MIARDSPRMGNGKGTRSVMRLLNGWAVKAAENG